MEEWSASEANLFEEALDKYGKDFNDIRQVIPRPLCLPNLSFAPLHVSTCNCVSSKLSSLVFLLQDFLPWKTLKSIVEYYYMWKTTDRYVQQKRLKAAEAESKLKQVRRCHGDVVDDGNSIPDEISGVVSWLSGWRSTSASLTVSSRFTFPTTTNPIRRPSRSPA